MEISIYEDIIRFVRAAGRRARMPRQSITVGVQPPPATTRHQRDVRAAIVAWRVSLRQRVADQRAPTSHPMVSRRELHTYSIVTNYNIISTEDLWMTCLSSDEGVFI